MCGPLLLVHTGLRQVIEEEDAKTLHEWVRAVIAWESRGEDGKLNGVVVPNPYKPKTKRE